MSLNKYMEMDLLLWDNAKCNVKETRVLSELSLKKVSSSKQATHLILVLNIDHK